MSLHLANGTRVTQATVSTVNDPDPIVVLQTDLFERERTGREDGWKEGKLLKLAYRAGTKFRQSQLRNLFQAAKVRTVSPNEGETAGGTDVVVRGNDLDSVTAATVGGAAVTALNVISDTELRFKTPARTAGAKDLVLTDEKGTTTVTGAFTYKA